MNGEEILKLIDAGFTADEVRKMQTETSEPPAPSEPQEVRHLYFATRKTEGLELKCIIKKNENLFQFSADIAAEGGE